MDTKLNERIKLLLERYEAIKQDKAKKFDLRELNGHLLRGKIIKS